MENKLSLQALKLWASSMSSEAVTGYSDLLYWCPIRNYLGVVWTSHTYFMSRRGDREIHPLPLAFSNLIKSIDRIGRLPYRVHAEISAGLLLELISRVELDMSLMFTA